MDGGKAVFEVLAGWRGATAFAMQIEETRVIDNDKDSWDVFLQGMSVYGYKTIQPEGVAALYVNFD
jgi:hypothetical protein